MQNMQFNISLTFYVFQTPENRIFTAMTDSQDIGAINNIKHLQTKYNSGN